MPKMLRLQIHLLRGGEVTVDAAEHTLGANYAVAVLAPSTRPVITFTDNVLCEYTFAVTLRGHPAGLGA